MLTDYLGTCTDVCRNTRAHARARAHARTHTHLSICPSKRHTSKTAYMYAGGGEGGVDSQQGSGGSLLNIAQGTGFEYTSVHSAFVDTTIMINRPAVSRS